MREGGRGRGRGSVFVRMCVCVLALMRVCVCMNTCMSVRGCGDMYVCWALLNFNQNSAFLTCVTELDQI